MRAEQTDPSDDLFDSMLISTAGKGADVQAFQARDGQGCKARRFRKCARSDQGAPEAGRTPRETSPKATSRGQVGQGRSGEAERCGKPKAVGKPRKGLAETVAWIEAGGMPARPPAARIRTTVPRGASFKLASYASDQGKRSYKLYIPAKSKVGPQPCAPMPLVVMLHGCGQTPDDFAAGTRMNALAEEFGLLVAYPSQPAGRELQQMLELVRALRSGPRDRRAVADCRNSPNDLARSSG